MAEISLNDDQLSYYIELSFNNFAERFIVPLLPESIEVKEEGQSKTYNIVGKGGGTEETRAGEVNVIKSPKLREVSFSSTLPGQAYPFISVNPSALKAPFEYIEYIRKWMATKHPIRFIFVGSKIKSFVGKTITEADMIHDLNFPASIESFTWKEVAGSPGDIEYTIRLKEYVFYSARRATVVTLPNGETALVQDPPNRPDERIRPDTYTLRDGEGLLEAAKRMLDDDGRWREIQKLNKIPEDQLENLPPGTVLLIPKT